MIWAFLQVTIHIIERQKSCSLLFVLALCCSTELGARWSKHTWQKITGIRIAQCQIERMDASGIRELHLLQAICKLSARSFTQNSDLAWTSTFFLTAIHRQKYSRSGPHHEVFGVIVGILRGKSGRKSLNIGRDYGFPSHHHCGPSLLCSLGHAPRCHWLGWLLYLG